EEDEPAGGPRTSSGDIAEADLPGADASGQREGRLADLERLRSLAADLLEHAPREGAGAEEVLKGAEYFLSAHARSACRMDAYAREKLVEETGELAQALKREGAPPGWDAGRSLAELPEAVRVGGQGPRPGCLYVSNLARGGHSGRRHTFLLGLDDARFPGANLQDPLLLDSERARLSARLSTTRDAPAGKMESFRRLLARLRGEVTLCYPSRDLVEDGRELFPAGVLIHAYRILSAERAGDPSSFRQWLGDPAAFVSQEASGAFDTGEWWLWLMLRGGGLPDAESLLGEAFPHLGRGWEARRARSSERFTAYDGHVPEAGREHDPFQPQGPVLSASRLECLGRAPLEYFFRYVLELEPPEEYGAEPDVWLDPPQKGKILHRVFCLFMKALRSRDLLPELARDEATLFDILEREVRRWRAALPPPREDLFDRDREELRLAARVFLIEEERFSPKSRPAWFEVAAGMARAGGGSALDAEAPVALALPDGRSVRVRGRIDRIDEVPGSDGPEFTVWDYKTGSLRKYREKGPFDQGRFVQPYLYLALAEALLRAKVSPRARVRDFGYIFPGRWDRGERISWPRGKLLEGRGLVSRLCDMLAAGVFPFSDCEKDASPYAGYLPAIGDAAQAAREARRKLACSENEALAGFRALRGLEEEADHDGETAS
ncbi:MAG: PD-(D/E)XK nuclease family protein, partial [Planctomycetota bacterium]